MISLINNNPIIYAARKQTPCNCNNNKTLLKGKLEENIQKVQDQNERKTELEQREGKELPQNIKNSAYEILNKPISPFFTIVGSNLQDSLHDFEYAKHI